MILLACNHCLLSKDFKNFSLAKAPDFAQMFQSNVK